MIQQLASVHTTNQDISERGKLNCYLSWVSIKFYYKLIQAKIEYSAWKAHFILCHYWSFI